MTMPESVTTYWRRIFDFKGRSSRSEYWWVFLFNIIFVVAIIFAMSFVGGDIDTPDNMAGLPQILYWVYMGFIIVNIIPALALNVRRLHDQDKTGWWLLIYIVPFGSIVLLVFMCRKGTHGPNPYGYDTLGGHGDVFD